MSQWARAERRDLLHRVRLLSQLRAGKHGPLPVEPDLEVWWTQIIAIAIDKQIAMPSREQWHEAARPEMWEQPL